MVENEIQGSIIFNTSIRGFEPHSSDAVYGGLKAALDRSIRSFAIDLGRYGIRVNGFSPGVTNVRCPEPKDEKENPFYRYTHKFIPRDAMDMLQIWGCGFLAGFRKGFLCNRSEYLC
jgi:glucose 1-dehydrogenase